MNRSQDKPILIIGASGLVGRRLAETMLAEGRRIRSLARDPGRLVDLARAGCEIIKGDIADLAAVSAASRDVLAVYISIHTLSPQPASGAGARFMDVETRGIKNVVEASRASGFRRVVYLTSLGISANAPSEWLRERWLTEQLLLESGLDATVLRPGHIVGVGGQGFDMVVAQAKRRMALTLSGDRPKMRTIGLDDLVYYLRAVLDEPRAFGHRYEVGSEDVLSMNQMIDIVADVLGNAHPRKLQMPRQLLSALAPFIERMGKLPAGALTGLLDSLKVDMIGDPAPIRALLPRAVLAFRPSAKLALANTGAPRG